MGLQLNSSITAPCTPWMVCVRTISFTAFHPLTRWVGTALVKRFCACCFSASRAAIWDSSSWLWRSSSCGAEETRGGDDETESDSRRVGTQR